MARVCSAAATDRARRSRRWLCPGLPRDGWDHAQLWLPHGLALTGLEPRFIVAELTLADVTPAMSELIPLARKSRADAERAVDDLWSQGAMAA